jgi:hypothetical protein
MKKRVLREILALALVFGFVLAGCGSAPPDLTGVSTYYVRDNGNDRNAGISEQKPFKTLTRAVEAASGSAVKTITVIGTLTTALPNITKGTGTAEILITGRADEAAKDKAVLQIPKEGEAFTVGGDSRIRFEHITVTGGKRGGIKVNEGATVTLGQGAVVSGNSRAYGGGLAINKGTLVLCDNALVAKNTANAGGGIAVLGSGTLLMQDDALVSENETVLDDEGEDGEGGGVYAESAEITMEGNAAIVKNTGYWGGGIYINAKSSLVMQGGASIRDNTMFYRTLEDGTHIGGTGGGAYIAGSLTMRDTSVVSGNDAASGGGIFLGKGTLVMEDRSTVKNNDANAGTESDGTLFGGNGGGVRLEGGSLTMKGESSLDGNSGFYGGGLHANDDASIVLEGKAAVRNNETKWNQEKKHGGYGGGVNLSASVSLVLKDDAAITGNTAVLAGGGALFSGKLTLEGKAVITGNSSQLLGGGVYINKGGSITGDTSLISGNESLADADICIAEE